MCVFVCDCMSVLVPALACADACARAGACVFQLSDENAALCHY